LHHTRGKVGKTVSQAFVRNKRSRYRSVKSQEETEAQRMELDNGGRPNRSSDETLETRWSEGFGLFVFMMIYNLPKGEDD
jgi:hypothetical protein